MWHGTWQEANEDGSSRWEVLDTPPPTPATARVCTQWAHRVGGSGPQALAHVPGQNTGWCRGTVSVGVS